MVLLNSRKEDTTMTISPDTLSLLFNEDQTDYATRQGFESNYCPGFSDNNPLGLPCDCPKARHALLEGHEESLVCSLGVCPVRLIINYL